MTLSVTHLWDDYVRASTVPEALQARQELGTKAPFLAGGTDLILLLEQRHESVPAVIDLSRIAELQGIFLDGAEIVIGAGTTLREIETSPLIAAHAPSLVQAARTIGSVQIRHMATLVGNVVNASPAADGVPPLLTLEAEVVAAGSNGGERRLPLERFLLGPRRVHLAPDELVTQIRFPVPSPASRMVFFKVGLRRAMAIATVNAALLVEMAGQRVANARMAFGAVAPTAFRAREAERLLAGEIPSEDLIERAAEIAQGAASPITDFRASAAYRTRLVGNLAREGLRMLTSDT